MAKVIKLRKGLDVKLKGTAALETLPVKMSEEYAPSTASTVTGWADKANANYAANLAPYITQTGTSSFYPYIINLVNGTLHLDLIMDNPVQNPDASSVAKLVFGWRNDVNGGTQPGAIITNLIYRFLEARSGDGKVYDFLLYAGFDRLPDFKSLSSKKTGDPSTRVPPRLLCRTSTPSPPTKCGWLLTALPTPAFGSPKPSPPIVR